VRVFRFISRLVLASKVAMASKDRRPLRQLCRFRQGNCACPESQRTNLFTLSPKVEMSLFFASS
jgi:hypothetical protein